MFIRGCRSGEVLSVPAKGKFLGPNEGFLGSGGRVSSESHDSHDSEASVSFQKQHFACLSNVFLVRLVELNFVHVLIGEIVLGAFRFDSNDEMTTSAMDELEELLNDLQTTDVPQSSTEGLE